MKFRAITLITSAGTAFATATPDEAAIVAKENAIWDAAQHKRLDQFQQLVAPTVRAVFADGIMTMANELQAIPKRTMKSVRLGNFNVVLADWLIAIVTYLATVETASGGNETSATSNCGSLWQMQYGRWQAIFHGEAEMAPASAAPSH
ncbi:MAG TPA: nuclear transport factor 2 family protein [Chthoniobacterales bacterium]|jgi:hypothetical protein